MTLLVIDLKHFEDFVMNCQIIIQKVIEYSFPPTLYGDKHLHSCQFAS